MSKNIISGKNTNSVYEISKIMKDNNVGFLPIMKDGLNIGVITDRDIVIRAVAVNDINGNIESYISKNIISCEINEKIDCVLEAMKKNKIKRVLISDSGKMVGIVSISDILNHRKVLETIKGIYEIENDNKFKTEVDEFNL